MTSIYRFESETKPVTPLRLKVETNTREHLCVLGQCRTRFQVDSPWHSGAAEVLTYEPEELVGTKLRALYQRKKGRGVSFDPAAALERVREAFLSRLPEGKSRKKRKERRRP
jgi:hypothetical protein